MPLSFALDEKERVFLGFQAKHAIQSSLGGDKSASPQEPDAAFSENSPLFRDLGSFVTLSLHGSLRGCIGSIIGREPLYLNVWNMGRAAAFEDLRFPPLSPTEWDSVKMEISVLDQPSPCPDPGEIVIGRDGLILRHLGRIGVFLPQVPVEQGWNLREYLDHLCIKAGLPQGSWKQPRAELFWYQAQVFPA